MVDVVVRDETMTGQAIESWSLPGLPVEMSARELLRLRVRDEVARRRATGLVPADPTEPWAAQADAACRAFDRNGFVMLVGDRQIESLDEMIDLRTEPSVAFVRLVPLVGG
ncbi:hypothetical protein O7635_31065 [Asanoa sp. WMMD1127]|uniref:hypothetical protein n=1 Tax=Asanoa sp. WMMD1127 TaxID=3016107 RepID=UPI00241733B2|nr:hypothetical protein [Asanoa sp. WMMD1127]MDG4826313.1 hypothetical protein [Asanoa sp. WMMD1127]